ncbi:MAG TPA: AlkA N-terminal domain-containing protein [Methylibium sp.]|nr:AlkA N-terminal domain-containing protein [Methylibium sp.]
MDPLLIEGIAADAAYRAWETRDARFDGRLFVGVTSTGIYCRPVCRVRLPKRANMRFYGNAASAERDGFRPCLRCRPELAPGLSLADSSQTLAEQAALLMREAVHGGRAVSVPAIAARLGVTDRHLRRIFQAAHGVTPIDFLTTQRLLLAKQLLTDTAEPVTAIAHASGFESLRRFNAAFAQRYRLSPSALRREGRPAAAAAGSGGLRLRLGWRPPYDIAAMLGFLARRPMAGVEAVEGAVWRRTLALPHDGRLLHGWLVGRFDTERHELQVEVAPTLAPVLGSVLQRLRLAFDLDADPERIDAALASLPVPQRAGLRLPGAIDGFETAVRVILGQQVTVKAACTLTQRLVERFGMPVDTPFADLRRLFPDASTLAAADAADIGTLGIVRQRVGAIQALARAVAAGAIELHRAAPLVATLDALRALPGIGEWTAQVIAMRALAWPDAWPAGDIGLHHALGTRDARRTTELAEAWRPWRAYAVMRLWHHLETSA